MPIPAPSEAEHETPIVDIHEWGSIEARGEALFGASSAARRGPSPAQDVLLYWLSPAHVARLAVIDASLATISLRRAFLVRITLPAVPTA